MKENIRGSFGNSNEFFGFVVERSLTHMNSLSFITPCEQIAKQWTLGLNHVKMRLKSLVPRVLFELYPFVVKVTRFNFKISPTSIIGNIFSK